jgi:glycosyltransferase involved in cell wall biosynthesis
VRNIYHHLSPSILWELKRQRVPVLYHLNDFQLLCPNYNLVANGQACERCRGGRFWRAVTQGCYSGGRAAGAVLATQAYVHRWLRTYEKCVDRFLAPSQFVRDKLVEYGWPQDKIDILPHFQQVGEDSPAPANDGAPVLYFGRLSAEKGISDLLHAMSRLPSIPLKIAGNGPLRADLESLAQKLGLRTVEFAGHVQGPELDRLIDEACFTVLPSRAYETLGKTILESYARGRAVIASDMGSRREFVRHGETGLLYRAGEVGQLAEALSFLNQRPELAAKMGRAGRKFVRERHSPASHYQAIATLYNTMATEKAGRGKKADSLACNPTPPNGRVRVAFIGGRGVIGKYSGIESYYENVGSRLAASGHEVTVYCRTYFTPSQSSHDGMRLVRLPTLRTKHLETVLHTLLSTVHAMFGPYDIVHYHALGPALFSIFPRLAGKKTAVTVQGLDWQRKKWGRLASAILQLGEQAAVRLPNSTMVVSRSLQSYYRERYSSETVYVANGADLRERRQPSRMREWGIDPGNYILYLGRFSPEKNCHPLIEAFERIETDVRLVLAGGAKISDTYAQQLHRRASNRVRFLDYVSGDAFEELLTNAMLFVLPSDMEGLSLALLEAMSAGLCTLTSDIPENRELVEGVGFTFRRGDVADLELMLRFLIADREVREDAGRSAKRRVEEQYLWGKVTHEIEGVYLGMMGRKDAVSQPPSTSGDVQEANPSKRDLVA